jgi:hypothetical protein
MVWFNTARRTQHKQQPNNKQLNFSALLLLLLLLLPEAAAHMMMHDGAKLHRTSAPAQSQSIKSTQRDTVLFCSTMQATTTTTTTTKTSTIHPANRLVTHAAIEKEELVRCLALVVEEHTGNVLAVDAVWVSVCECVGECVCKCVCACVGESV